MKRLIGIATVLVLAVAMWMSRGELLRMIPIPFLPIPAHEQYATALAITGVSSSEAGRAWLDAATRALEHPVEASAWFSATGEFEASPSSAMAWRFAARRGQRVTIDVGTSADSAFLDLFTEGSREHVASAAPDATLLSYIVENDGALIARAQPRLSPLDTTYDITQHVEASLEFPVHGMDRHAIGSSFGVGRDAGRRRHEGIDIFAPRRTPVVAALDGWVTPQTTNRLGGKVVWLWAPTRRLSLYYAHLDEQAVTPGTRVSAGDLLGYVGNTGNARATAPHLHFGVYAAVAGAVDPFPFVVDPVKPDERTEARTRR